MRRAIKPRQIINYDAGIVLSDLHQQRKNNWSIQIADTEYGATSCQRRTEPAEQQPQHPLSCGSNKLTSLLSLKGPGIFSTWVIEAVRLTSEKAYTSIKSDEKIDIRVLPSEQDDIVNSLNYARALQ